MSRTVNPDGPLSLRRAAALLGCSHTAVREMLRRGVLADLWPATVRALAARGDWARPRGGLRGNGSRPVYAPDGALFAPSVVAAARQLGYPPTSLARERLAPYEDGYQLVNLTPALLRRVKGVE